MPIHHRFSDRGSELRALRLRLLRLRDELGLIRRDRWLRKYNPNQARVPAGYPATVRIDAVEYRSDGTMCIYDFKTGKAGLSASRSYDLGAAGYLSRPGFNRAIVIEVRPRRR